MAEKINEAKEPPLAQPELSETNGIIKDHQCGRLAPLNSTNLSGDSVVVSPSCVSLPVDISTLINLPQNLTSLYGRPFTINRRIEKDKKIVLYVLAADGNHQMEKAILVKLLQNNLKDKYNNKGFEIHVADLHTDNCQKSNRFDLENWLDGPLEAQSGHHLAANCLAEITSNKLIETNYLVAVTIILFPSCSGHSTDSYVIPLLFLNSTLGDPLLPLTIEYQDFSNAIAIADNCGKQLLEKWYTLDERSQPSCYRLKSLKIEKENIESIDEELNELLVKLIEVFPKELKDSYLTTIVEVCCAVLRALERFKHCSHFMFNSKK